MDNRRRDRRIDMTEGPIMRNILLFALPLVLGNILQQLYTTVDTLVIGAFCGTTSLAAVGTSAQPVEVVLCVFLGLGTGTSILISQYIGAGNRNKTLEICGTSVAFVWVCGIAVGGLGMLAAPGILRLMQVPEDTLPLATLYVRIVLAGSLGNIGYNMNAGILRGMGNSTASLAFLLVSCVVNIALDVTMVAGFGMDVAGAALATSAAMFFSWGFSIHYIRKHYPELSFPLFTLRISQEHIRAILRIGLPIGLNNSLYSLGHMAMQTLVNSQGSIFMAGQAVAGRITGMANIAVSGMSSAATTFSGQNYGAGRYDRLRRGRWVIPAAAGAITLTSCLLFLAGRTPLLRLFSSDPQVLFYANRYVSVQLLSLWMFSVFNAMLCLVNGAGLVRYTTIVNLLMLWAIRIPSAYAIRTFFDGTWIMLCFPISFLFGMLCMTGYNLFSREWREILNRENRDPAA
ncbi:MAG: MATE family efflux transporter [Clostridia bacterium]|nr:MATE family efflux transporter [Clostridia bacterium]